MASRMLGHSNVSMTRRYAHLAEWDIKDTAERVGQSIAEIIEILAQTYCELSAERMRCHILCADAGRTMRNARCWRVHSGRFR